MTARHLVIFAKEPRMGRVKTRLAKDIGTVRAWAFYRTALNGLMRRLGRDRRWQTILAVAPDNAVRQDRIWENARTRVPQGRGDLGIRMQNTFDILPPGPVVIVGADIPDIECAHIARAFRQLGPHDAIFGRADDGGYWLVGHRRVPRMPRLFQGVRWSGPHALSDTLANVPNHSVGYLEELLDVDDGADFERWRSQRKVRQPWKAAR